MDGTRLEEILLETNLAHITRTRLSKFKLYRDSVKIVAKSTGLLLE